MGNMLVWGLWDALLVLTLAAFDIGRFGRWRPGRQRSDVFSSQMDVCLWLVSIHQSKPAAEARHAETRQGSAVWGGQELHHWISQSHYWKACKRTLVYCNVCILFWGFVSTFTPSYSFLHILFTYLHKWQTYFTCFKKYLFHQIFLNLWQNF